MEAPAEADPMVALVESWDTYLVPSSEQTSLTKAPGQYRPLADQSTHAFALETPPFRYHLTDACPIFASTKQDNSDQETLRALGPDITRTFADGSAAPSPTSLLWLLTLVSRNVELLRAAAHLFLQFNAQFSTLVESNAMTVSALRERHQHQLVSLLEVADNHDMSDMIVDTTVTERVVLQQQQELDAAERRCAAVEQRLEEELQEMLWRFLSTSAPDAVAAANRKQKLLGGTNEGGRGGSDGSVYRAEVDVSRFAEVRKSDPLNMRRCNTAVAPFSPVRLVPVRTIRLSSTGGDVPAAAAAASSTQSASKKSQDSAVQPIILDVSPLSGLSRCLGCCIGTQPGAIASSVSSAAEEHLLRLAHTRHSVLLFIGSESAAMDVMQSCKAPELLLGTGHSCRDRFQPLANHHVLRILFTTRLWGANVVLLWNPAQDAVCGSNERLAVEDALKLAYAWDADMFSVAVLEGATLPSCAVPFGVPATATGASSTSAAFFTTHAVSMEVLRQLRNGVTGELLDTGGTRRVRGWQGTASWMQQGIGSTDAAMTGTYMCPRSVGALYGSQPVRQVQENQGQPQGVLCAASSIRSNAAFPLGGTNAVPSATSSSFLVTQTSPPGTLCGPCITFNTPLAIRVFLPLAEEYFIREQPNLMGRPSRGEVDVHHSVSDGPSSSTLTQEGGGVQGLLRRHASATATDDDDASFSSEKDARFLHGRSSATSAPASNPCIDAMKASNSNDQTALRRHPEMTLESLLHHAFGDLAEVL